MERLQNGPRLYRPPRCPDSPSSPAIPMKLIEGIHYYIDPTTGYDVWTATYLADRGFCCNGGCRHCPYDATGALLVTSGSSLTIIPEVSTGQ